MQIYSAVWGSLGVTGDRRALRRFAVQPQEAQLRSHQFALPLIHSGPENSQGWRQGLVFWPLFVNQVKRDLCLSGLSSWFHLCALSMSPRAPVHSLVPSQPLKDLKFLWGQHPPADCDQNQILKHESVKLWQVPFSLSCPAGSWSCSVLLAVVFSPLLWSVRITHNEPQAMKVWQWKKNIP